MLGKAAKTRRPKENKRGKDTREHKRAKGIKRGENITRSKRQQNIEAGTRDQEEQERGVKEKVDIEGKEYGTKPDEDSLDTSEENGKDYSENTTEEDEEGEEQQEDEEYEYGMSQNGRKRKRRIWPVDT